MMTSMKMLKTTEEAAI